MTLYIQLALRANSAPPPFFTPRPRSAKRKKEKRKNPSISSSIRTPMKAPSIPQRRDRMSGVGEKNNSHPQAHHEHPLSLPGGWLHLPILAPERERRIPPEETSTWPRTPRRQRQRHRKEGLLRGLRCVLECQAPPPPQRRISTAVNVETIISPLSPGHLSIQ
ncbi:uncharacterized protein BO95DRAFT_14328 [Aspergillus brunneoviolaceus CBS 621.78]|uniref:Uncharacterized protein n=1 Tax=Aspergillus brunneoviolaceus CBS 621.78 TaxID=1450534 RepID=A0ACD1GJ41_9EURO|nr:hypothetical protein BO95DRAFT_14328 [Aspergillus brunneoviolaceus CBS 621.78]RAH49350.1 hypothetical protein BO95DRAFT_14328 [Aspergillus brunneoviolaceus CBS 621.78]